jgi:hypothetical protein
MTEFLDAKTNPPKMGECVLAIFQEWGCAPGRAIARPWQSGQEIKWYMDREFYHYDGPFREIGAEVLFWAPFPQPSDEQISFIRSRISRVPLSDQMNLF